MKSESFRPNSDVRAAWRGAVLSLALFLASTLGLVARGGQLQNKANQQREDEPIKLHTTLVQVPVIVTRPGGRYVTDLARKDFVIFEDGERQEVAFFGSAEEPINVALLLDSSSSTAEHLDFIKTCAFAFIDNLRPHDRVMVISFDDSVQIRCDFTSDRTTLKRAVSDVRSGEFTQVFEAVYTAVWEKLHDIDGRKAVILFSDGIDNASSEILEEDTLDALIESEDVIMYSIRYATREAVELKTERRLREQLREREPQEIEREVDKSLRDLDRAYRKADEYLQRLADLSGGVVARADGLGDIAGAFAKIAEELRHQYLLGYYPPDIQRSGGERKISVKVLREGLKVRARPGYRVSQ
jgi:VWFA-related protein